MQETQEKAQKIALSIPEIAAKYSINPVEVCSNPAMPVQWGAGNGLVNTFINVRESSATLSSCINNMHNYILGDAIEISTDIATMQKQVNRRGTTMRGFLSQIVDDYLTTGNFAFQIIYNKLFQVAELIPLDVCKCRLNGYQDKVLYNNKGWGRYSSKYETYERFGYGDGNALTCIYFYNGDNRRYVYNRPMWFSALIDVLTEIECSKYSLNTVGSGFSAKYCLNLPNAGNLTDEQKTEIENGIQKKFTGTETTSNFMIYYPDSKDNVLTVAKIESDDAPEKYIAIKNNCRENIFCAFRSNPILMGKYEGTGFSTEEYKNAFAIFQKTVISPIQDIFLEVLKQVFKKDEPIHIIPFSIA